MKHSMNKGLIVLFLLLVLSVFSFAEQKLFSNNLLITGYANVRYGFTGSASSTTSYSGMRLTGSFDVRTASDKFHFVYRSHHFLHFSRPENFIYSEAYKNFNIFNTAYFELRNVLVNGLQVRAGRQFPETEGAAAYIIDGVWARWNRDKWSVLGSAGRPVDIWNGTGSASTFQYLGGIAWNAPALQWSANLMSNKYESINNYELSANIGAKLYENLWIYSNIAYDSGKGFPNQSGTLSRASINLSWHKNNAYFSLMASQWQNPFDQFVIDQKTSSLPYWGNFGAQPPSKYQDVRFTGSYSYGQWRMRGTVGTLQGVRSGWLAQAHLQVPPIFKMRFGGGVQAMRTDFIDLFALEATLSMHLYRMEIRVQSRARLYKWLPDKTGFKYTDNFSSAEIEYPMLKNMYILFKAGIYFRELGNESTKPLIESNILYRF